MIKPLNQNTPSFVTPDAEKPDLSKGSYLSFTGDNGFVAYIQMTNERAIWIKQVGSEGARIYNLTFGAECGELITNYLVQRLREIEK